MVTHDAGETQSALTVGGTLSVGFLSRLDMTGKGLAAGQSIDAITGQVINTHVDYSRDGGSHGGAGGGSSPDTYGDAENPTTLGGGGVSSAWAGNLQNGGRGGGAMVISADTLLLEGQMLADGAPGNAGCDSCGGGGAGGSLNITMNTFSGDGFMSASGGDGLLRSGVIDDSRSGRGGGGGRIAIYYATKTYSGAIVVDGGSGYTGDTLSEAGTLHEAEQ